MVQNKWIRLLGHAMTLITQKKKKHRVTMVYNDTLLLNHHLRFFRCILL